MKPDNLLFNLGNLSREGLAAGTPTAESMAGLNRRTTMLWTITVVLVILWLVGLVGGYTLGGWIHILIVLAVISLIFNLLSGRRAL